LEQPKDFRNFEVSDGLIYRKENGQSLLCIPHVLIRGRNIGEMTISEAHSLLAYLGVNRTLSYLRDHVWWKTRVNDTRIYCDSCQTCGRSKPGNQKLYGLLNPLTVPERPWEAIGVDFVGPLPQSKNRDGAFIKL
jgi:hypothetical protein